MKEKVVFISLYQKKDFLDFIYSLDKLGYEIYSYGSTVKELKKKNLTVYEIIDKSHMHYAVIEAIRKGYYKDGNFSLKRPDIIVTDLPEPDDELDNENYILSAPDNSNLIRFASAYYKDILIVTDSSDCFNILEKIKIFQNDIPIETKKYYASKALNLLSYNEAKLSRLLFNNISFSNDRVVIPIKKKFDFDYGENPHQKASFYILTGEKEQNIPYLLKGKNLNLNHYIDLNILNDLIFSISEPACAISKHGNIVSLGISDRLFLAFQKAIESDLTACFSGVCSFNRILDAKTALLLSENYIECISAPDFEKEAIDIFKSKKKEIRLIKSPIIFSSPGKTEIFNISGGFVIQERDDTDIMNKYKVVTRRKPDLEEMRILKYIALISKYSKTYSAVFFSENTAITISGPQPSVYDAIKVLIEKAKYKKAFTKSHKLALGVNGALNLKAINELSDFNISAIIQPGNWLEDEQCIEFCNKRNISMLFTHLRHYKH